MRELIKNDVFQWQFMSCKNINKNNNVCVRAALIISSGI